MKKLSLIALMIVSSHVFSQINFGIGITQNFGNIFADNGDYQPNKFNLHPGSTGLNISLSKVNDTGWYPELKLDVSFLSDTSVLYNRDAFVTVPGEVNESYSTDQIQRVYDYNSSAYKTSHQTIQLTFNRKVSKWFSLGGGLAMDIRKTKYNDLNGLATFQWSESDSTYIYSSDQNFNVNDYSKSSVNLMIPINLRFHYPIKKSELILSTSMMLANNNHSYLQTGLIFWF